MASTIPDPAQCASRLRSAVSLLARQLRSGSAAADSPSVAKLSVLGQLHQHGPCTPTTLAGLARVKLQSLTRLLAELEDGGWALPIFDPRFYIHNPSLLFQQPLALISLGLWIWM